MPHVNSPANPTRRHRKHGKKHHDDPHMDEEQEHKSRSPSPHEHAIPSSPSQKRISVESPRYAESGAISTSAKYAVQSTAIEDNPVPETHHILLFVNPRSGNCHGRILLEELGIQLLQLRTLPNVIIHIYNFLDKDDITGAIQRINSLLRANKGKRKDNPVSINVWSAGGDGTLMSVVQLLVDADVPLKELTFAVIPFGTGNDLSQVLGWGKTIEREQLSDIKRFGELVEERVKGDVTGFDVFEVTITTHEGGGIRKFTSTGFSDVTTRLDTHMGNYSGVGVQGWVGGDFEHSRTGHRLWNIAMYAYQSARWIWRGFDKIQNIDRIEAGGKIAAVGKNSQAAKDAKKRGEKIPVLAAEPIEFVIQNIPGIWGRAIDLWDNAETGHGVINGEGPTDEKNWTQQRCDDQQLEVYCITSLSSYAAKQFSETARKHLTRIGQFQSPLTFHFYKVKHGHETCMLIDGEFFYIKDIATLTYTHKRTINMAKGKEAKLDQPNISS